MNSINTKNMVSTITTNKQHNCHKQNKHQSLKDLLYREVETAPVSHAEMTELKAELDSNTTQTKAGRTTTSGGRRQL